MFWYYDLFQYFKWSLVGIADVGEKEGLLEKHKGSQLIRILISLKEEY